MLNLAKYVKIVCGWGIGTIAIATHPPPRCAQPAGYAYLTVSLAHSVRVSSIQHTIYHIHICAYAVCDTTQYISYCAHSTALMIDSTCL